MKLKIEVRKELKGPLAQMTLKTLSDVNNLLERKIEVHNNTFTMGDFRRMPFFVLVEDEKGLLDASTMAGRTNTPTMLDTG